jgi:hypothetical protein
VAQNLHVAFPALSQREGIQMKSLIVLAVLLPLTARADLIWLDYEGAVVNSSHDDYAIGSPITGRLTIDTALAGPDIDPRENFGHYGFNIFGEPNVVADFVGSDLLCSRRCPSADMVFATKDFGDTVIPNMDLYEVDDAINGANSRMTISIRAPDILVDEGISQSFELNGGATMFGLLQEKGRRLLDFAISYVRVTPVGRCSP